MFVVFDIQVLTDTEIKWRDMMFKSDGPWTPPLDAVKGGLLSSKNETIYICKANKIIGRVRENIYS
jgi:hypothetical protein